MGPDHHVRRGTATVRPTQQSAGPRDQRSTKRSVRVTPRDYRSTRPSPVRRTGQRSLENSVVLRVAKPSTTRVRSSSFEGGYRREFATIAAIATIDPRTDVVAATTGAQSLRSVGSLIGTKTVLPGCGFGSDFQNTNFRRAVSTLPFGCITYARPPSPFDVGPPAART